ncbi:hypothetical protein ABT237_20915 [Streptomyces sp. NPDC001581]|uniref:hypothetical protein n=1 Tax=Streptomyces sp. NPDC001581 TaxID=3154386 RepID=UPI0033317B91
MTEPQARSAYEPNTDLPNLSQEEFDRRRKVLLEELERQGLKWPDFADGNYVVIYDNGDL